MRSNLRTTRAYVYGTEREREHLTFDLFNCGCVRMLMLISVLETIIGMVLTHTHYAGSNKLCTTYYVILSALHRAHICSVHVFMRAHNIQRLVYINIRTHAHIQTVMEFPIACGLS